MPEGRPADYRPLDDLPRERTLDPVAEAARGLRTQYQVQRAMVWCGVPLMMFTAGGLTLAGMLPIPVGSDWAAERVAQFYGAHPTATRAGLVLAMIGLTMLGPLTAVVCAQLRRIPHAPAALANLQQMGGTLVIVVTVLPMITMNTAAFRPERDPAITMAPWSTTSASSPLGPGCSS